MNKEAYYDNPQKTNALIPLSIARNPEFKNTIQFARRVEIRRERLLNRLERGFRGKNSQRETLCVDLINDLAVELNALTGTMRAVHMFRRAQKSHNQIEES